MDLGKVGWAHASTRTVLSALIYVQYQANPCYDPDPEVCIEAADALLAALEEDRETPDAIEGACKALLRTHYKAHLRDDIRFLLSTSEKEYIRAHPEWWAKTKLIIQQDLAAEETDL